MTEDIKEPETYDEWWDLVHEHWTEIENAMWKYMDMGAQTIFDRRTGEKILLEEEDATRGLEVSHLKDMMHRRFLDYILAADKKMRQQGEMDSKGIISVLVRSSHLLQEKRIQG